MRVEVLTGDAIVAVLDDLARLRITVFRDFPYLYDGSLDYERDYMRSYVTSKTAVLVGAFNGDQLVGAATGTPLSDHADDFAEPFKHHPVPMSDIFYCAESVLLSDYRGRGIGHAFMDAREDHARSLGATHSAFCSVIRPMDHPLKPDAYAPLDPFWRKRGYAPLPNVKARFDWKDVDQDASTVKELQFWMRAL